MDLEIKDVAELLSLSECSVRRLISKGELPAYQLKKRQYRFSREEIENWLMQQKSKGKLRKESNSRKKEEPLLGTMQFNLFRALSRGEVFDQIRGTTKREIFRAAMDFMTSRYDFDADVLCDLFMDREQLMPTALNHGIAVPHARDFRLNLHHDLLVVVYPELPLDYGALDGKPVHTLFFIFANDDRNHLLLLAKLAHLNSQENAREFLQTKPSKSALLAYIKEWESTLKS